MGVIGAIYQTVWTLWRQRGARCPWCATYGQKTHLWSVTTARGYVLRCWQCGGEYVEHVQGQEQEHGLRLKQVWPK